jgi:hypothetical protein
LFTALETLSKLDAEIGIFINDSDHSAQYEAKEYDAVLPLLSSRSVILSDNAHSTPVLADFALADNLKFLFWREQPANHWYRGAGIGFADK